MIEKDNTPAAEDLPLEGSEAESVVGGMSAMDNANTYSIESEMFRLMSAGYVEEGCTTEGTVMVDPKTNHRVTVKTVL
jgi:hypothetical protein